jgi:hypothetical protein
MRRILPMSIRTGIHTLKRKVNPKSQKSFGKISKKNHNTSDYTLEIFYTMHYIFLKNILESVLANFTCPQCHNKTNDQSIKVTGISSHGIDIHIHCHICSTHSQLNAEINTIAGQMLQNENGKKFLEEFLKNG